MIKKGDVILLLIVVFCIFAGIALSNDSNLNSITSWNNSSSNSKAGEIIAIIKKDDVAIKTINLSNIKNREIIKISGHYGATIIAEHNRICYFDSNCPDKTCKKTGWLNKVGDIAVCIPNKIIIKLTQQ